MQTTIPETAKPVKRRGIVSMGKETVREMRMVNVCPVLSRPEIIVRRTQTIASRVEI